ncbi:hypothetical protein RHGRI_012904 [Rhododendron griersonianum]|uniref:Uncharacterized protein n=1 Tax=Rhododendron griersonianum TaxID=479676 RepID=A0AAV6K3L1_9ERIC|nr:hypothetical protein RHGRI_012904 [Rhododendron griersonianum]
MSWQSSTVSFLHGKSSLVMKVLMLLTKILKFDKRPMKLKESDTKSDGYSMESSISMKGQYISLSSLIVTIECENGDKKKHKQSTLRPGRRGFGTRLAKAGYGVYGMDYEGHGDHMVFRDTYLASKMLLQTAPTTTRESPVS